MERKQITSSVERQADGRLRYMVGYEYVDGTRLYAWSMTSTADADAYLDALVRRSGGPSKVPAADLSGMGVEG